MTNTVYIINRCDYLVDDFFKEFIPGCEVEDDCVLKLDGKEYDIVLMDVVGANAQRDLQFYTLVEYIQNKEKEYTTEDIEIAYRQGNFDGNSMARMLHKEIPSFNSSKEYVDSLKNK